MHSQKNYVSNAEDVIKALKPIKDVTILMSEERNRTVCLITQLNAQPLTDNTGDSAVFKEIKHAIKADLLKRYNSEAEKNKPSYSL